MFVVFAATDLDQRCLELKDLGIKRLVYVFFLQIFWQEGRVGYYCINGVLPR